MIIANQKVGLELRCAAFAWRCGSPVLLIFGSRTDRCIRPFNSHAALLLREVPQVPSTTAQSLHFILTSKGVVTTTTSDGTAMRTQQATQATIHTHVLDWKASIRSLLRSKPRERPQAQCQQISHYDIRVVLVRRCGSRHAWRPRLARTQCKSYTRDGSSHVARHGGRS